LFLEDQTTTGPAKKGAFQTRRNSGPELFMEDQTTTTTTGPKKGAFETRRFKDIHTKRVG
jgi:hypothetical protein